MFQLLYNNWNFIFSVIVLVLVGCRHHVIYNSVGRLPSEYIHLSQTWKHAMRHLYLCNGSSSQFFLYISVCIFYFGYLCFVVNLVQTLNLHRHFLSFGSKSFSSWITCLKISNPPSHIWISQSGWQINFSH